MLIDIVYNHTFPMYLFPEISANSQRMSKFRNNIKTMRTVALVYITKAEEIVVFSACPQGRVF